MVIQVCGPLTAWGQIQAHTHTHIQTHIPTVPGLKYGTIDQVLLG